MRFPSVFTAVLLATALSAQGYDPVRSATGWARQDRDGTITFYDATTQTLRTWSRDGGELGTVPIGRLETPPEKWVIDTYGNAWIVSAGTLYLADAKTGKVTSKERLPGDVSDIAWDIRGFVLSYRGSEPFVEKRDYRNGAVLWSYGNKPKRAGSGNIQRVAITDEGQVLLVVGAGMTMTMIEGGKGKAIGQMAFTYNGLPASDLVTSGLERGPMAVWSGKNCVLTAVSGRQVPEAKMSGALLARMDLGQSSVEFLPTGLTEDHVLVGVHDGQAVYLKPGGGLAMVAVR